MTTSKRIDGHTPHGGAYSIAFFKDKSGEPCSEQDAKKIVIVEYSNKDEPIYTTYANL